jgi:catechol 2,3-dioxygenase-like lactoylglutathione lyase family enzyme
VTERPPELHWPTWVGVVADDLEAQRRFYRDVLGLRERDSGDDWLQFDLDGKTFELVARSDVPQYDRRRYQVGFAVGDLRAARAELIARGVEAISEIEGDPDAGAAWCYFRDPEGNVFELTQRPSV